MMLTPHRKDYHEYANQGCLLSAIYAYGDMPARYPVPAIREHFEWARNLLTNEIVILHCHQERWP